MKLAPMIGAAMAILALEKDAPEPRAAQRLDPFVGDTAGGADMSLGEN
jgi:hypothetical protein